MQSQIDASLIDASVRQRCTDQTTLHQILVVIVLLRSTVLSTTGSFNWLKRANCSKKTLLQFFLVETREQLDLETVISLFITVNELSVISGVQFGLKSYV